MLILLEQKILQNNFRWNCLKILRYLSTKPESSEKKTFISPQRQYARPDSSQVNTKPYDNFIMNLFKGYFNISIFNFPSALQEENGDLLLKHCFQIGSHVKTISVLNKDTVADIADLEAFGLPLPQKYGGSGYSEREVKFVQECAAVNFNVAKFMVNNDIGCKIINDFGSEEQKEKYLPRLASGESFITLAYIENSPAIDLTTMEARAVYNDKNNTFLLNGYKKLVHNANVSDLILLLTKTNSLDEYESHESKYKVFIVEKDTPGVTINQLKAKGIRELDLFEISFDKVEVSKFNMIKSDYCGTLILKYGMGYGELGTSVICLSLLKRIINSLTDHIKNKQDLNKPLSKFSNAVTVMGELNAFIYALESVIYFCADRFDKFGRKNDMFAELVIPKLFAVDVLQMALEKYVQILGPDCFKSKALLDEAFKVLKYATSFNENIFYLKLMLGNIGLLEASKPLTPIIKKIKKPDQNPMEFFQWVFRKENRKFFGKKLNLKNELNENLKSSADNLEESVIEFEKVLKDTLFIYGSLTIKEETHIARLTEIIVYIYACAVVLGRASKCINSESSDCEIDYNAAILFSGLASQKLNHILTQVSQYRNLNEVLQEIGELSFEQKQYPVAHPLIKTF